MARVFDCSDCGIHVTEWDGSESLSLVLDPVRCAECRWIALEPEPIIRAQLRRALRMGIKVAPAV